MELIFTISVSVSCSCVSFCSHIIDHTALGMSAHFFEMFNLVASFTFLPIYQASISVYGSYHSICTLLCSHFNWCGQFCLVCLPSSFCHIIFFTSLKLLITAAWALWVSILSAPDQYSLTRYHHIFITFIEFHDYFC